MKRRHSRGLTSVPVAIMSTVTAMRGFVGVAELVEQFIGFLAGRFGGDLLAEVVALAEGLRG